MSDNQTAVLARRHCVGLAPALVIVVAYLLIRPKALDFASGDFRAQLFKRHVLLWNNLWFGGHSLPGYGIVSPVLNGVFGVVPVAVVSVVVSSWCFVLICHWCTERNPSLANPRLAIILFSVSTCVSLWGGRLTFGPAVAFGTACIAAQQRDRIIIACVCAALCGLSSPVGVVSLGIILGACFIANALPRKQLVITSIACVVPVGAVMILFPEQGWYPFTWRSLFMLTLALSIVGWFGRRYKVIWVGAVFYFVVAVLAFMWRSPLGGNIVRLGWLAAGSVAALTITNHRRTLVPAFAIFTLIWTWAYVNLGFVPKDVVADSAFFTPLSNYVLAMPGGPQRVEVLPTVSFSQADGLALQIGIARGWETQLDRELNPEFFGHQLTAQNFHAWLLRNSVSLVAVPQAHLHENSLDEEAIINSNPGYLQLQWSNPNWHLYRVIDAQPLADNSATVTQVEPDSLTIDAPKLGTTTVRFRYTKWYRIVSGDACVTESSDGWIDLAVHSPGTIHMQATIFGNGAEDTNQEQCSAAK